MGTTMFTVRFFLTRAILVLMAVAGTKGMSLDEKILNAMNGAKRCVADCHGRADGDYQSCEKCQGYVSCSGGYLYSRPCPGNLVWDDNLKRCEWTSPTCSLEDSETPVEVDHSRCKRSCRGLASGNYQSCDGCNQYVACSHGVLHNMPCPASLVWDDNLKRCEWTSPTCGVDAEDDQTMEGSKPNSVLTELDIMMTKSKYENMVGARRYRRKTFRHREFRWSYNTIPYHITDDFSDSEKDIIVQAMSDWQRYTCLRFRPRRNSDTNYLVVFSGRGCWSYVGMEGGIQPLSLSPGCRSHSTVLHELGHALGLIHEQSRPDRDDFVTVITENIQEGMLSNFHKFSSRYINTYDINYDYTSIMHYGKKFFSKNGRPTLETKDETYVDKIGSSKYFSFRDVAAVNAMYFCSSHCQYANIRDCTRELGREAFLGRDCTCWCHLYWKYH